MHVLLTSPGGCVDVTQSINQSVIACLQEIGCDWQNSFMEGQGWKEGICSNENVGLSMY